MVEQAIAATTDERVDRLGMFASTACAVHCAVCALVPAAFATLGLDILLDEKFEWLLTILAVGFGLVAMVMGWRRHRKLRVMVILSVGIIGLLSVRLTGGHHSEHADHGVHGQHGKEIHHANHDDDKHHAEHAGHAGDEKHEGQHLAEHPHEETGHEDHEHGSAEALGIFAGLILLMGHVSNLQEMRRRRDPEPSGDESCDDS